MNRISRNFLLILCTGWLTLATPVTGFSQTGSATSRWSAPRQDQPKDGTARPEKQSALRSEVTLRGQSPDTGWLYPESPVELGIRDAFRHAFFRVEYLHWDIEHPGNQILGSFPGEVLDGSRSNLSGTNILTSSAFDGTAPTADNAKIDHNNGIRGTFGLLMDDVSWETSAFTLQSSNVGLGGNPVISPTSITSPDAATRLVVPVNLIAGQPILLDGANSNFLLVYDDVDRPTSAPTVDLDLRDYNRPNYRAFLKTSVWGTESNLVFDSAMPNDSATIQPIFGVRYQQFRETLHQEGEYYAIDGLGNQQTGSTFSQRSIDSRAVNHFYGPQVGFRAQVSGKMYSLGFEPKVLVGLNTYRTELRTSRIFSPNNTDPTADLSLAGNFQYEADQIKQETKTNFGPLLDLKLYGNLNLTDHWRLVGSYQFQWMAFAQRPIQNILYGAASPDLLTDESLVKPAFQLEKHDRTIYMHGFTIGAEYTY